MRLLIYPTFTNLLLYHSLADIIHQPGTTLGQGFDYTGGYY
jgi:hypothetical protein